MRRILQSACAGLSALCAAGLLLCSQTVAGDLAQAAVQGELWTKSTGELAQEVLGGVACRPVDGKTLLLQRSAALGFGGIPSGDIKMRLSEDLQKVLSLDTTIFNKGDNGELDKATFEQLLKASVEHLNMLTGVDAQQRVVSKKEAGLKMRAWEWETSTCYVLLEAASTGAGKKYVAEFIRLTMTPEKAALERGGADDAAKRADLKSHVCTEKDGSVWIKGIPMVDQGEKGYCVPASVSRVFAYYGMDGVDQHALAALCKSSGAEGTTIDDMEKALRTISGSFHMGVVSWKWLNMKTLAKDYAKRAQKLNASPYELDPRVLLETIKGKPALLRKGMAFIRKNIDAGIPLVWGVALGLFPEMGIPQSGGGHMRLIVGYNEQRQEVLYSDSWGAGHECKKMPLSQACAISQALYVLRPLR